MKKISLLIIFLLALSVSLSAQQSPNIILIYADDLGYGDLSCYGATKIKTPNIDKLAKQGIRFTNGHSTSATCTPSRYALMTGQYPWRKEGTNILPGDAKLIIPENILTLPKLLQKAGYKTAIVGKWHLGLGNTVEKNWNGEIKPGPNETGFDYSFIFPATADRVPTVFLENHKVIGLDSTDPIQVDYAKKTGNEPTGRENPELLKMKHAFGHDGTIVNGIGRIGFMSGGRTTRWTDEELPFAFLNKAKQFVRENSSKPFFLYYAMTEPHVPRMPSTLFKGKSLLGSRGDVILQMDWAVGELMEYLRLLKLDKNTLIIFSSDNGPVLNDGYMDDAVEKLNGHTASGILRGGKYSIFEAGTRVPLIVSWPGKIKTGLSDAMINQVDLIASFAKMTHQHLSTPDAPDSYDVWDALTGKTKNGRTMMVEHGRTLAILQNNWKYIEPCNGDAVSKHENIETGINPLPQLYDLKNDLGERNNLAEKYPDKVKELQGLLKKIKEEGRNRN
ncbi:MAG TPA: arylsulfatase [Ferruginibacter sp.]|nr:arylsulfatase [Ferruginibacter sp.]